MAKQLRVFPSMAGTYAVGWVRDDVKVVHVFANARSGQRFRPSNGRGGPHWPCEICESHGFTEQDFHNQIRAALAKGPAWPRNESDGGEAT